MKAIRKMAERLCVFAAYLETGTASPVEQGVTDTGIVFGSRTRKELRTVEEAADDAAREGARRAAERVPEDRQKAERAQSRKRLKELGG